MLLVGFCFGEMEVSDENYRAFWKGYRLAKENEKSKKEAVKAEMNKQQLIDKAIDELDGVWREDSRDVPLTMLLHSSGNKVALSGSINEWVTRQEFEARKAERDALKGGVDFVEQARKELGLENTIINKQWQLDAIEEKIAEIKARKPEQHWYDYENQKALRLPPVGEVVQMVTNLDEVRIVAHDNGFAVYWYEWFAEYQHTDAYELFRPLDWDKRMDAAVNELTEIIKASAIDGVSAVGIADAILAAGYRKCDNKTPSDKE